jgi:hypothetical protein
MNKSILALGMALAIAGADLANGALVFTKLDLNANFSLAGSGDTTGFPFGNNTILGNVPFQQSGAFGEVWNANYLANGSSQSSGTQTLTLSTSVADARGSYSIINTWWGASGPSSYASVTFNFSDSSYMTSNLVGNVDIRDFNYTGFYTTTINDTSTRNVYLRAAGSFPNPYALDRQWFDFGVNSGKTLTSVVFTDTGSAGLQRMLVSGATVQSGQSGQITGPAIGPGGAPINAVPEPGQVAASLLLLGGIGGYVFLKRRKAAKVALAA